MTSASVCVLLLLLSWPSTSASFSTARLTTLRPQHDLARISPMAMPKLSAVRRPAVITMAVEQDAAVRPRLTFGRVMVAVAYGKYGVLYPFLPVYLKAYLQLPAIWVGVLAMIFPVCIAVISPMITSFADSCGQHKRIFLTTQIMSAAFAVLLFLVGGQTWLIFGLLLSWASSDAAMTAFTDSALLGLMGDHKGGYGQMRCFGSLGYAATVFASGQLQNLFGWAAPFFGMSLLSLTFAGIISTLPHDIFIKAERQAIHHKSAKTVTFGTANAINTAAKNAVAKNNIVPVEIVGPSEPSAMVSRMNRNRASRYSSAHAHMMESWRAEEALAAAAAEAARLEERAASRVRRVQLARQKRVQAARAELWRESMAGRGLGSASTMIFLGSVLACGIAQGVMDNCLFLRLRDLGAASGLMGLGRAAMCVSEVPFFYFSGRLYKRFGMEKIMLFAVCTHVLQSRAYFLMVDPRFCLLTESLNGVVWGFMWPCALLHAQKLVPDCLKTTMVGLVTSIYWGVGASAGALATAYLYARVGSATTFLTLSQVLVLPACLLAARVMLAREDEEPRRVAVSAA